MWLRTQIIHCFIKSFKLMYIVSLQDRVAPLFPLAACVRPYKVIFWYIANQKANYNIRISDVTVLEELA